MLPGRPLLMNRCAMTKEWSWPEDADFTNVVGWNSWRNSRCITWLLGSGLPFPDSKFTSLNRLSTLLQTADSAQTCYSFWCQVVLSHRHALSVLWLCSMGALKLHFDTTILERRSRRGAGTMIWMRSVVVLLEVGVDVTESSWSVTQ